MLPLASNYHVLEIGTGTAAFTEAVLQAVPQARITATDISSISVEEALNRIRHFPNVDFLGTLASCPGPGLGDPTCFLQQVQNQLQSSQEP